MERRLIPSSSIVFARRSGNIITVRIQYAREEQEGDFQSSIRMDSGNTIISINDIFLDADIERPTRDRLRDITIDLSTLSAVGREVLIRTLDRSLPVPYVQTIRREVALLIRCPKRGD